MGKPIFTFGQPQVKWTEIDESIVLPIHQNQEKNTLVFIDSEWGEPNKLEYISDSQTYLEKFGKLIDPTKSQKGYDYLPHYLQGNLQGNIPMYVMRVGFPDTGSTIDDYKQMTEYEIGNQDINEYFKLTQKHQGLFGKDLGIKVYYNSLFKMYSIDVINLLKYVPQEDNDENEDEILESFKEKSFKQLVEKVNQRSKYINLGFIKDITISEGETSNQVNNESLTSQVDGSETTFTLQNGSIEENSVEIIIDLNEILSINDENLTSQVDGSETTFTLQNDSIVENSVEIEIHENGGDTITVSDETPTGIIDGQNDSFTIQNDGNNIVPESVTLEHSYNQDTTNETPIGDIDGQNQTFNVNQHDLEPNSISIKIIENVDETNESPSGDINGQNQTYTLQNTPIIENSVSIAKDSLLVVSSETPTGTINGQNDTFYLSNGNIQTGSFEVIVDGLSNLIDDGQGNLINEVTETQETPSGDINSTNMTYTLQNTDVTPETVSIVVDGGTQITDTDDGDGTGTLSDGGSITYQTGEFTLNQQPTTTVVQDYIYEENAGSIVYNSGEFTLNQQPTSSVVQDYTYFELSFITDNGYGNLSDGGTINYTTGEFTLNSQPQTGDLLSQDYTYADTLNTITDDGQGNLSDDGTITYSTGEFTLNSQPIQSTYVLIDYTHGVTQVSYDNGSGDFDGLANLNYLTGELVFVSQPQTGDTLSVSYQYYSTESSITRITDDGQGNLSDGGTITYSTGEFTLNSQPQADILLYQTYSYNGTETVTDDGQGNLSDGGTITYSTGEFTLNSQPDLSLQVSYNYLTYTSQPYIESLDVKHYINNKFEIYTNVDIDSTITELNETVLVDGDMVRLNNQTDTTENGLYEWSESTELLTLVEEDFTTTKLFDFLNNEKYIIEMSMQYKDESEDVIPRVKQQDSFDYFDGVDDSIIKDNLVEGTSFNEQASLEVDFSEQMNQLIQNYEITSPDFGHIRYIQTLGLQSHEQFNNESHEHYQEYEQFINEIHTKFIQPRRNLVLITEPKDYSDDETQVDNQLLSSNDIWSDLKGSYIAMYFPWILEKRQKIDLHLPPSFDVIQKLYQHTPNLQVQGIRRGRISESSIPVHVVSDSEKDDLSQDNVNSLMFFPHYKGTYIWDEKTHYNKLSQLSRLSQRLIMIEIEERVNREMGFFLFEPLIEDTFNRIKQRQDYILSEYKGMNWIYDYQIDLDTSLELLDNHMVILKLLIKPIKNLEFIEIKQYVRSYQNQTQEF